MMQKSIMALSRRHDMSTHPAPLSLYSTVVPRDWVDYNGHLRDGYYLVIYSAAGDALIDYIGLDARQREFRGRSIFTLEAHVNYLREVKEGTRVEIQSRVLGHDAKRIHVYFEMFADGNDEPLSASEQMWLHVDVSGPRAAVFDPDVFARVDEIDAVHRTLPPARYAGRVIALPNASRRTSPSP
jgi:acyl-CoA thioester hydrolase